VGRLPMNERPPVTRLTHSVPDTVYREKLISINQENQDHE